MNSALPKVCIIGAGPAGLAMARACVVMGLSYDQYDAHSDVGGLWDIKQQGSPMYDSAHFISSKTMSGFDGLPMPEQYPDYPSHQQILQYIHAFADQWQLRDKISFQTKVVDIEKLQDDSWQVKLSTGESKNYLAVVCATGSNWFPRLPKFAGEFSGEIRHSSTYRSPDEFKGKRVMVIGAGNSGVDIACDAATHADKAFLSVRRGYHFVPKHICGVPTDVFAASGPQLPLWMQRMVLGGLLRFYVGDITRLGLPKADHKLLESHPILNTQVLYYMQHGDLIAKPDVERLEGRSVLFKDGSREELDMILLATGYNQVQPYARDYFRYEGGRPNMYLQLFSREHKNLLAPSFIETNSGAFKLFDLMAFAIANHLNDQLQGKPQAKWLAEMIQRDEPDLTGGIDFVKSDRHAAYFDSKTWQNYLKKIYRTMGWTLPTEHPAVLQQAATTARSASLAHSG
ncbi:flavin-containing monooxygenase [Rheinheimera sediminis]|uniref:flavin-containing monooxygenase n=1 Tax=Rheinheimera sp. YQF-1 TaxID=2499626 RepID=UPI001C9501F6|nr:NAD(P)-binding domain-containing protein [Rheinheimera sp. YQF-1]